MTSEIEQEDNRHYQARVSIRIMDGYVDPDIITRELGLTPDGVFRRGDRQRNRIHTATFWHKRLSEAWYPPTELTEQLDRIVTNLEKHGDFIRSLRAGGARVEFFVGWFFRRNSGDVVDHKLMQRLGSLGIDLSFDVYADCDD